MHYVHLFFHLDPEKHLADEKQIHCGELIKRLHACHDRGFVHKTLGRCNGIKTELDACLREERLQRTAKNKEASKTMNAAKQARWKEIDENR